MNTLTKLQSNQNLTEEALLNRTNMQLEYERRLNRGLVGNERSNGNEQIKDYLERIYKKYPDVDLFIDELLGDKSWKKTPKLVITMPVVGTGGQETKTVVRTINKLKEDPLIISGDVAVLVFVNRPEGTTADDTAMIIQREMGCLNGIIIESEIPMNMGDSDGPFEEEMTLTPNDVPIALIRDILSIGAMKIWAKNGRDTTPPLLLQMDGDFEGLDGGTFADVIGKLGNPKTEFVQFTSDWAGETGGDSIVALQVGCLLMKELPQILKRALNDRSLPVDSRQQILFGEAIQRGIQVPQMERMANVARKGGYGLLRMREDELDNNIRLSGLLNPVGVSSSQTPVFNWNNRRVLSAWAQFKNPPISQWTGSGFTANDPVRGDGQKLEQEVCESDLELVINKTLARFPVPLVLEGVYGDCRAAIASVLRESKVTFRDFRLEEKSGGLCVVQINI